MIKKIIENRARELLFGSRAFPIIRDAYQRLFDRDKLKSRRRTEALFTRFISPGDLVFDVGANLGEYAETFLTLGARVVAVEPNPVCCDRLERLAHRGGSLSIERCAIGDREGVQSLNICSDPGLSTLSGAWREAVQGSPLHAGVEWTSAIEVRMVTLDALAARYGVPTFVKIDVEGFEDRVLAGMSFRPRALSFEFHFQFKPLTEACLNSPALRGYAFNYIEGMNTDFALPEWQSAAALSVSLDRTIPTEEFGDIYCRVQSADVESFGENGKGRRSATK